MSQLDWTVVPPTVTSGTELAEMLSNFAQAFQSNSLGLNRPPFASAGMLWTDNAGPNYELKIYNGHNDYRIGWVHKGAGADKFHVAVDAVDVAFNNGNGDLVATDVQAAIDELNNRIKALELP